jgi:hypothetical protein
LNASSLTAQPIAEMERRYTLLDALCVRDIASFNVKAAKWTHTTDPLPHIIVVIDEVADLIAVTGQGDTRFRERFAACAEAYEDNDATACGMFRLPLIERAAEAFRVGGCRTESSCCSRD